MGMVTGAFVWGFEVCVLDVTDNTWALIKLNLLLPLLLLFPSLAEATLTPKYNTIQGATKNDPNCVDWVCLTLFGNFLAQTMIKRLKNCPGMGENNYKKSQKNNFLGPQLLICTSMFPDFSQHSGQFVYFRFVDFLVWLC